MRQIENMWREGDGNSEGMGLEYAKFNATVHTVYPIDAVPFTDPTTDDEVTVTITSKLEQHHLRQVLRITFEKGDVNIELTAERIAYMIFRETQLSETQVYPPYYHGKEPPPDLWGQRFVFEAMS